MSLISFLNPEAIPDNSIESSKIKTDGKVFSDNNYTTEEKEKLAGIAAEANNYVLPVATSEAIGGVKSGTDITVDGNGNVSVNDDSHNHVISNVDGLQTALDGKAASSHIHVIGDVTNLQNTLNTKAPLESPAFIGTPTAPTAAVNTNTTQVATTEFVVAEINNKIAAADAMIYKGTIGTGGTVTSLPSTTAKIGWTYKVITAGSYDGQACEVGDMIVCLTAGSKTKSATWTVIQANIDGAVIGPASSVENQVAVFSGTTGKVIKAASLISNSITIPVPKVYEAITSANTTSISAATHGCGDKPVVQCYENGAVVVCAILIDDSGNITVEFNGTHTVKIRVIGMSTQTLSDFIRLS